MSCSEIRISPICAWPIRTALLIAVAGNREALGKTLIAILPPVTSARSRANALRFSV